MQTLVFAALVLTGLGVQAGQVVPSEHVQLLEHGMSMGSGMDNPCGDMALTSSSALGGESFSVESSSMESSSMDCDMDPVDCQSACANCQAASNPTPSFYSAVAASLVMPEVLATVAAQYSIDHPPKLLSSL